MPTSQVFWDKAALKYAKSPITDMAAYDLTLNRTRAYLAPDDQTLELGCGTGTTALRLAGSVGHITATDISGAMIHIARDKAAQQGVGNVTFHRVALRTAGEKGPYDKVMAFNLLHLIEGLPGALMSVNDKLKPGGLFISKSACVAESRWYLRLMVGIMRMIGKAPFVGFLTIHDLDRHILEAGFTIVETHTFPGMMPTRFVVARKA